MYAISDPGEISDPAYAEGLRAAVAAAIAYGIETTGREGDEAPIPVALLAQARMAARVSIPLDTVLRRYFAGYSLLGYFILEEAFNAGIADGEELQRLLGAHAGLFDRLLAAVGEEHAREAEILTQPTAYRRQVERIERLLAGEQIDTAEIPYEFDGWHLGMLASGDGDTQRAIADLASTLDCRTLIVPREEGAVWAWLRARHRLEPSRLIDDAVGRSDLSTLAFGEPAEGLPGWRLTHRQAAAALPVAKRRPGSVARYRDVAVLASASQDDLLSMSMRQLYLEPLKADRDGRSVARETLGTYFSAGRNASSAAAALGVSRQTVHSRLKAIETLTGHSISDNALAIEVALLLDESSADR